MIASRIDKGVSYQAELWIICPKKGQMFENCFEKMRPAWNIFLKLYSGQKTIQRELKKSV